MEAWAGTEQRNSCHRNAVPCDPLSLPVLFPLCVHSVTPMLPLPQRERVERPEDARLNRMGRQQLVVFMNLFKAPGPLLSS